MLLINALAIDMEWENQFDCMDAFGDKSDFTNMTKKNLWVNVIRDKSNEEIWFLGAVYEPHSWEDDKAEYQYN